MKNAKNVANVTYRREKLRTIMTHPQCLDMMNQQQHDVTNGHQLHSKEERTGKAAATENT